MADETVVENTAEQPPAEVTETQVPPPEAVEAPPEVVPEPTAAEKAKQWDADRQKRDEAKAAKQKALEEQVAAQAARQAALETEIAELKKAKTPPTPAPPTADELAAMADEIESRNDPASNLYDLDAARALESKLRKATLERQRVIEANQRRRDEQDAAADANSRWWNNWQANHPEHDRAKAEALVKQIADKHAARHQGTALDAAVEVEFGIRMDEAKKVTKPPATTRTAAKTASSTSVSAPVGTQVVPVTTGARQNPTKFKEAESLLERTMRAIRGERP